MLSPALVERFLGYGSPIVTRGERGVNANLYGSQRNRGLLESKTPKKNKSREIPLPKGWGAHVKSAIVHIIALAQYALMVVEVRGGEKQRPSSDSRIAEPPGGWHASVRTYHPPKFHAHVGTSTEAFKRCSLTCVGRPRPPQRDREWV